MSTSRIEDNISNSGSGRAKSVIVQPTDEQSVYHDQGERTESFDEYPLPHNVNLLHLSKAGFFYTPRTTSVHRVTCIGCSRIVNQWMRGDVPSDSKFHEPYCRFIKDSLPGTSGVRPLAQSPVESTKPYVVARNVLHESLPERQLAEERVSAYIQRLPTIPGTSEHASAPAVIRQSFVRSIRNTATGDEEQSLHRFETRSNHSSGRDISSAHHARHSSSSEGGHPVPPIDNPTTSRQPEEDHRFESQRSIYPQSGYLSRIENSQGLDTFLSGLDMRIAQNRLYTFEELWYDDNEFRNKRLLVTCGFYCIGQGDAVECFHCHVVVANWSRNDNPRTRHEEMSPDCRFLIDDDCGDQPLSLQRTGRVAPIPSTDTLYNRSPSAAGSYRNLNLTRPLVNTTRNEEFRPHPSLHQPQTEYTSSPHRQNVHNEARSVPNSPLRNLRDPDQREGNSPYRVVALRQPRLTVETRHSSISPQRGGRHRSQPRGRTLSGSASFHPHTSSAPPVSPHHSVISQLTEEPPGVNRPSTSNRRRYPWDPTSPQRPSASGGTEGPSPPKRRALAPLRRLDPQPPPYHSLNPPPPRTEQSQPHSSQPTSTSGRRIWAREYPCPHPANPNMVDARVREATFRPPFQRYSRLNASIRELAEAGFYYTGEMDRVRCFYCHGGLANFEPNDNIWDEHAKFHPHCDFLRQQRGPSWVESIASRHEHLRPVPIDQLPPVESSGPLPPPPPPITDPEELRRQREEIFHTGMTSEPVRAARDAGYAEDRIRHVQWTNVCNRGACYQSTEALVNALIDDDWYQNHPRDASDAITTMSPRSEIREDGIYVDGMPMEQYMANQLNTPLFHGANVERNVRGSNVTMQTVYTRTRRNIKPPSPLSQSTEHRDMASTSRRRPERVSTVPGSGERHSSGSGSRAASNDSTTNETTSRPSARRRLEMLEQEKLCNVCMNSEASVLFDPCGHICSCQACADGTNNCYVCRAPIQRKIQTYRS